MQPEATPGYIVDTNVVSSKVTFQKHPAVSRWLQENAGCLHISVISMAAIARGLNLLEASVNRERSGASQHGRRHALAEKRAWQNELSTQYGSKMVSIDLPIATRWAEISVRFPQLRDADRVILATAMTRRLVVATRNTRDFQAAGVPLVNPFDPATWGPKPGNDPIAALLG